MFFKPVADKEEEGEEKGRTLTFTRYDQALLLIFALAVVVLFFRADWLFALL
jgi:hypothetical protein